MENNEHTKQEFYEILVNNHEKGETYSIKFRDNPQIYTGIPILPRFQGNDEEKVVIKILTPENRKGVIEGSINDLEVLERLVV